MAMVAAKCTECGATISVDESREAGICPYCKTAFVTEKVIHEYVTNNVTNIGKVNIGKLNIQKSDFVSDIYFDEIDKILYGMKKKSYGDDYYDLPSGDYFKIVYELQKDYPNRAMTHYITAFVLLYVSRVCGETQRAGVASWKNQEWVLNRDLKNIVEAETTSLDGKKPDIKNPVTTSQYIHCYNVNHQYSQGFGNRPFCFEQYKEAKRLLTANEQNRYDDFISYVDKEIEAIKRCLPLYDQLIEKYNANKPIKNKSIKNKSFSKVVNIGIVVVIAVVIVFALICTVISTVMNNKKNDSSESLRLEQIVEE